MHQESRTFGSICTIRMCLLSLAFTEDSPSSLQITHCKDSSTLSLSLSRFLGSGRMSSSFPRMMGAGYLGYKRIIFYIIGPPERARQVCPNVVTSGSSTVLRTYVKLVRFFDFFDTTWQAKIGGGSHPAPLLMVAPSRWVFSTFFFKESSLYSRLVSKGCHGCPFESFVVCKDTIYSLAATSTVCVCVCL